MYTLICSTCNQSFISNNPATKICKQCKVGHCVICNKSFNRSWPYDQKTWSKSCRLKYLNSDEVRSRAKHNQKCSVESKYGVSNVSMLQSVRDKISYSNQSTAVQSRRKDTCLMRYGTAHPMQNTQIKLKAQRTFLSKYGVTNPSMNAEIKSKISTKLSSDESVANRRHTLFERYGVTSTNHIPGVRDKMISTTMEHYGVPYYVLTEEYRHPVNSNIVSKVNQNVAKLLNAASIATEFEFIISPRSYDIHILDTNILLEIDPTYTHCSEGTHWNRSGLSSDYHITKTNLAESHGYKCIHIFDWDDVTKIVDLFKSKTVVFARSCQAKLIDIDAANAFCDLYHLQSSCNGIKYSIGLFHSDRLVQVMTFGRPRYSSKYEWELLRLCTASDIKVVGGASKLFKHFIRDNHPQSIISYCDVAKFNGDVYYQLGMELHHTSAPAKIWSKGSKYITDNLLRQRGYDQLFKTSYGKGTSNEELMIQNGWRSVYDCGQKVFVRQFTEADWG